MDAARAGGGHFVRGPVSAGITYAEYWQALMATAEHAGQAIHADDSHEPVPAAKSPTPTPPPSGRAPPSPLAAASAYRLNLALTPNPHKVRQSPPPYQQQQQQPLHVTIMSKHVGEGEGEECIERSMRRCKEISAPAEKLTCKSSSARKSSPPAVCAGPWVPSPSVLGIATRPSDDEAGTVQVTDSIHGQRVRATVRGGTYTSENIFGDQRDLPAPSGDKDLVDSPHRHYSASDNISAQHAFSLTAGAAPVDSAYAYTPDDLVVKAAQCYEQWRRCVMEGNTDAYDSDDSAWECHFSDGNSSMAGDDEAGGAVAGIRLTDGPVRESTEPPCAAARNHTSSAPPHTPTDDRRSVLSSDRSDTLPDASLLCSSAYTRRKRTPSPSAGTHSRLHSAEATTHGLTSGRRDRDGDTDLTITPAAALPSLFTWTHASPVAKYPSLHVAPTDPTVFCRFCAQKEKVVERLSGETVEKMRVEGQGTHSHSAPLPPPQQQCYQHPSIQTPHCLHQEAGVHPGAATTAARSESTHWRHMSKDIRTVNGAAESFQSSSIAEADAVPLSFVYRRLFTDESEDGDGGVKVRLGFAGARRRESSGAANSDGALMPAPSSEKEHGQLPSDSLGVSSASQREVARMTSSDPAHNLTALTEVNHLHETLIELSSCCSEDEDNNNPVVEGEGVDDEITSQAESSLPQRERTSLHGTALPSGSQCALVLPSPSRPSIRPSVESAKSETEHRAALTGNGAHTTPAVAAKPLLCRDHPLWRKHHTSVSMLYASRLLPSEQANDELQLFLCWAQEKAERQRRWRQHHHHGDTDGSSETVLETSELGASPPVSCVVSGVHKVAYSTARRGKCTCAPSLQVQRSGLSGNNKREATTGVLPVEFASAQATSPSCQQTPYLLRPAVYVASPLLSSEEARSPSPPEERQWTLTPSAAPSRFVEWIATEVDPYESLLLSPL
ncbi:hypothetical protein Q4I28_002927 [Leishmania naiffi]|uniref:Uncharacterized protein n=1 Tax=Leishmania naiffi TaxID=5678 RepID=A0AAW3BUG9_9TRYP